MNKLISIFLIACLWGATISPASAQTSYVDRFNGSIVPSFGKSPAAVATTANITLSGYQTIDGVSINADYIYRVLVKNQTNPAQNGLYVAFSGTWIRSNDFAGPTGTAQGQLVYVYGGSTQSGLWQLTTANPVLIDGTTPSNITFGPYNLYGLGNAQVTATGTTASRTLSNFFSDLIAVTDFGVVMDGTTNNDTAVVAAVGAAYSGGYGLYWPVGSALTTVTIPHLHSVRHYGPGAIKRGSNVFYLSPTSSESDTLYIATTGNDANDGLGTSQPIATTQAAFNDLFNYSPLKGNWTVQGAAGTYTAGMFVNGLMSEKLITIKGPDVGGSPNVPTMIIDGTGDLVNQAGLFFQTGMRVQVQDIKVRNFTAFATSYGVVADAFTYMYTKNVHTTGNTYAGITGDDSSIVRIAGGIDSSNTTYGIRVHDNTDFTVGYQGAAGSNRVTIANNGAAGVAILTGSQGHVDFTDLSTNVNNIFLQDHARVHVSGSTATGTTTADVNQDSSSTWFNDNVTTNTFSSTVMFLNPLRAITTAQFDKTSNASYSAVPGLSVTLVSGTTYRVKAHLSVTSGASGGVAVALGGTASATLSATGKVWNGLTPENSQKTTSMSGAVGSYTGIATEVDIDGTFICTGSGTLTIRFSQNASDGTASSILHPSYLTADIINGGS